MPSADQRSAITAPAGRAATRSRTRLPPGANPDIELANQYLSGPCPGGSQGTVCRCGAEALKVALPSESVPHQQKKGLPTRGYPTLVRSSARQRVWGSIFGRSSARQRVWGSVCGCPTSRQRVWGSVFGRSTAREPVLAPFFTLQTLAEPVGTPFFSRYCGREPVGELLFCRLDIPEWAARPLLRTSDRAEAGREPVFRP